MNSRSILVLCLIFLGVSFRSMGQMACPDNIDFETGTTNVWSYYIGSCCSGAGAIIMGTTPVAPIANRHRITSGSTTDPYGGFPIVAPGGGSYSMKLGNSGVNYQAERARYYVHVPTGITNYGLVYRFAVVLEDPSHAAAIQPRFLVGATDSATGAPVNGTCATYSYVAGGSLPGFMTSSAGSSVYYLPWTTASINLSGLGGTTVIIDFTSCDCGAGGHFGYGYLDMNCSLFALSSLACDSNHNTLTAPFGYASYDWWDSATYTTSYGHTQTVTLTTTVPTTYAVVLTPYTGYGCPDTLYTHITPSNLQIVPMRDTTLCFSSALTLDIHATDIIGPLTYSWSPATGLSCTSCANPIATPTGPMTYYVTVTNPAGCEKTDTINIFGDFIPVSIANTPVSCFGGTDGTATVTSTVSLTYLWLTSPPRYTATATGLAAGTYTVTITDSIGCSGNLITTITEPPAKILVIADSTDPTTCQGADGTIKLSGMVPGSTDTITYVDHGVPRQVIITASATGTYIFTGLTQGVYDSFAIITSLCPYNMTGGVVLTDPAPPATPYAGSSSPVCLGDPLNITVIETTAGCAYNWIGPGGFTSTLQNPTISPAVYADSGQYKVVISKANCFVRDSTIVHIKPSPIPSANNSTPICAGDTIYFTSSSATAATAYSWSGPSFYSSTLQNPVINAANVAASGVYTVTVTLNGCVKTATTNVVVNYIPSGPGTIDTTYCQNDVPVQLSATGTNLLWYNTATGGVPLPMAPTPSTLIPGTYIWYVTQTTPAGCTGGRSQIKVTVVPMPEITLFFSDSVLCVGNDVTFFTSNTGESTTGITWHFGAGDSILNVNPAVHSFDATGLYTISAQTYYQKCASQIISKDVNVYASPKINLGNDTVMCGGSGVVFLKDYINALNPSAKWLWNTGETTSSITVAQPGLYFARVVIDGCDATDSVLITKDCYINIPNVFSPNGDGINDYFFPRDFLSKGLTKFNLDIYNRWGQLVFTTNKTEGKGWDGMMNGVQQPEGVFIYIIDGTFHDGKQEHHQGNVTLIR